MFLGKLYNEIQSCTIKSKFDVIIVVRRIYDNSVIASQLT